MKYFGKLGMGGYFFSRLYTRKRKAPLVYTEATDCPCGFVLLIYHKVET